MKSAEIKALFAQFARASAEDHLPDVRKMV
jgi:hypothetical protein